MRAISLWQPWATLWCLEEVKRFETRSWYTSYRGTLLVHAAKKKDGEVREFLQAKGVINTLARHGIEVGDLRYGAIIGQVELIGCCRMDHMPEPSDEERKWGNWSPDRYAWERADSPMLFLNPIPLRGGQRLFDVSVLNRR